MLLSHESRFPAQPERFAEGGAAKKPTWLTMGIKIYSICGIYYYGEVKNVERIPLPL